MQNYEIETSFVKEYSTQEEKAWGRGHGAWSREHGKRVWVYFTL